MAGVTNQHAIRGQFSAIAELRWRLFVNSLRTVKGRLEIVSRILMGFGFVVLGIGGLFGFAALAWFFISHNRAEGLAITLWPLFLFWQLFPVMATAFGENVDSSQLLRFPLTYRGYFLVRMAYGSLEPATIVGLLCLLGISFGLAIASFPIFLWAVPLLLLFAVFNIFLARLIFAWAEKWLARRRSREVVGVLFLVVIVGIQFIGPLVGRYARQYHGEPPITSATLLQVERYLPPGLVASSIADASRGHFTSAALAVGLLGLYTLAALALLSIRIHAQYRGENLSEAAARAPVGTVPLKTVARLGWRLPFVSEASSAVLEKEFRYLSRSGPVLFTIVMPVAILFIFRLGAQQTIKHGSVLDKGSGFAFPIGAAYTLLIVTNLVYNAFGADNVGIQLFFLSPARFREILMGKNLVHSVIVAIDVALVFLVTCFLYQPPSAVIFLATVAAVVFSLFVNLTVGNLLSLYTPKKMDFAVMGRQRASTVTAFASLGVHAGVLGLAAITVLLALASHRLWLAVPIFVVLAVAAVVVYFVVLNRVDKIAINQRESLIAELCRA